MMRSRSRSNAATSSSYSRSPPRSPSRSLSCSPSSRVSSPGRKRRVVRVGRGSEERESRPEGTRVHVGSLSMETSCRDLHKHFGRFGAILDLWMARTQPCFAFVVFRRKKDALKAIKWMDGEMLNNRRMRVTLARPRTKGTRSGGAFNPYLRCYQCGKMGHFSRVCRAHQWTPSRSDPRSRREMKERPEVRYTGNSRTAKRLNSTGGATYRKF